VRARRGRPPAHQQGRVTLELVSADGEVLAQGRASAELIPLESSARAI
jgi:hypothetical protein